MLNKCALLLVVAALWVMSSVAEASIGKTYRVVKIETPTVLLLEDVATGETLPCKIKYVGSIAPGYQEEARKAVEKYTSSGTVRLFGVAANDLSSGAVVIGDAGADLGIALIRRGYAYASESSKASALLYKEAMRFAKKMKRGVWSISHGNN